MENQQLKTCLYLDDVRIPTNVIPGYREWDVVTNYEEFTAYILLNGIPDLISFDHDLADEHVEDWSRQMIQQGFQFPDYESYKEKTGLDCAKFLVTHAQNYNLKLNKICVHSHNPVGGKNILEFLNGFKKHMGEMPDCFMNRYPYVLREKK